MNMQWKEQESGQVNLGMDVTSPTKPGNRFLFSICFCKYKRKGRCGVYDHLYNPVFYGRCNERICGKNIAGQGRKTEV